MKLKRLMALAIAGVMTLAMAGTALATPTEYEKEDGTKVTTWQLSDEGKDGLVKKILKCNEGVTLKQDVTFNFTITKVSGPDDITFTDKTITLPAGSGNGAFATGIKVTDAMFQDKKPGEYVFTIAEDVPTTLPEGWSTYNEGNKEYTLRVYKTNDATKKIEYTLKNGTDDKVNLAEFTNVYDPDIPNDQTTNAALTITKAVTGNEEYALITDYTFNASFDYTGLLTKGGKYQIGKVGATAAVDTDSWTDIGENGQITGITLKKGQSVFFKEIPQGVKYTITETSTQTELGTYFVGCDTSDGQAKTDGKTAAVIKYDDKPQTESIKVTFTNKFQGITPTGLAISVAPFVAMFAAVGAAIALYVAAKRRVR